MNTQAPRRLVLVAAIAGILALVPIEAGGASPSVLCPREGWTLVSGDRLAAQVGQPSDQAAAAPCAGHNGQQMWRSGKWLMS